MISKPGIGYLACEASGVIYFEDNKHFNERPIGVSWEMLKLSIMFMAISGGFQLVVLSFLTIWKKCDDRTKVPERSSFDRIVEATFSPIYERNPAYTVSVV